MQLGQGIGGIKGILLPTSWNRFVTDLNDKMRSGYSANLWVEMTGKTLSEISPQFSVEKDQTTIKSSLITNWIFVRMIE